METNAITVLIVDDSEGRLLIHSLIVKEAGYHVVTAVNGTDCLRIVQEQQIDIVLLDVVLPDINGVDVCRRLKSDPRTYSSLILLVSSIEIKSLNQSYGLDSGADGYVVLPVSNQELISRIRALERIKQSEDELRQSHQLLQQHAEELERINSILQHEIDEHRRTEAALRMSEEYSRSIIDCSLDMIITVDNERRIVEFNESAQRSFGYTREEVVGKHINILYADADEGKRVHTTAVGAGSVRSEVLNRRKNGEVFTSRIAASVLHNKEEQLLGIVGVSRDVTEQKLAEEALLESEERFRLLFTQSPLGILHIDPSGVILNANKTATEIFGIPREQRAQATIYEQLKHPKLIDAIVSSLNGIPGSYQGEFTSSLSGKTFTLRFISRPVTTRGSAFGSVIAIVEDITEQTVVQRKIMQSQKLHSLGLLSRGIAHDFNNLLSLILGNAEVLRRRLENDPALDKYVQGIILTAHRGASMTQQMTKLSRSGDYLLQPVSPAAVFEELKPLLAHLLPKSMDVVTDVEDGNHYIQCDKGHLQQVIINLCVHAKEAMDGDGTVTIAEQFIQATEVRKLVPESADGDYICLSVSYTGQSLSNHKIDQLFDPHFTHSEKGDSLGLSIVYGIVRSLNGYIDVRSQSGNGTMISLYIPAVDPHHTTASLSTRLQRYAGKRILLAGNELERVTEILQEQGATILAAADGLAVRKELAQQPTPDLLLIDSSFTGEDNTIPLYKIVRSLYPAMPLIVVLVDPNPVRRSEVLKEGVNRIVSIPIREEVIIRSVDDALTNAAAAVNTIDPIH